MMLVILAAVLLLSACNRDNSESFPAAPPMATTDQAFVVQNVAVDYGLSRQRFGTATTADTIIVESTAAEPEPQRQRHIIQTGWAELETKYFDDTVQSLRQIAPAANGYIESESLATRGRQIFNITLRIPSEYFQDVLLQIENLADVRHSRQSAEDVTDQFYDTTSRLATRRIEENRLLALIENAVYVSDILDLERRLSETRMQIEMYDARLTHMANQIAYSTIHVTVFDIAVHPMPTIAGPTLGDRIGGAFGDSVSSVTRGFQGFAVWLAGAIIPLVVWGGIIFGVYKLVRRVIKARVRT